MLLKEDVTLNYGSLAITGELHWVDYNSTNATGPQLVHLDSEEGDCPQSLHVNLDAYGLIPEPGHVFIKNYSEGIGITEQLVELGLVEKVRQVYFGPFDANAWEVRILPVTEKR